VLDIDAQLGRTGAPLTSATISGYRFVGRWGQSPNPVTNQGLRYVYQGFTNDGAYLVAFFYPVYSMVVMDRAVEVTRYRRMKTVLILFCSVHLLIGLALVAISRA
jgi:hypothetical protein